MAALAVVAVVAAAAMPTATRGAKRLRAVQTAHFVLELEDLLKEIFRHLDLGVDARAMRVCRQWRRVLAAAVASRLTLTLDDYVAGDSTGLSLPHGVGMMPRHYEGMARLLVADTRNDRLVAFTAGEKLCREIECPEIMVRPRTLTLTDEDLYITSFTQNNIIRIRYDAILTRNAERAPNCADVVSTEGDLWSPEGVCIHRGRLYCCSSKHNEVVSYTLQEETPLPVKHRFGADRLRDPTGIAWHAGYLYVADRGHDRLAVFSSSVGTFHREIRGFRQPVGVAFHHGRMYVSEQRRVVAMAPAGGAPLAVYSAPNCSLAHLCAGPRHVYVADCRNHVVHRLAVWRDAEGAEAPRSTASSPAK